MIAVNFTSAVFSQGAEWQDLFRVTGVTRARGERPARGWDGRGIIFPKSRKTVVAAPSDAVLLMLLLLLLSLVGRTSIPALVRFEENQELENWMKLLEDVCESA
uniref:Uncharacterized protein n=1 Tax=Anopheles atroparvus TaxID=41427 RepID=A0A182J7B8_ANOAO